MAGGRSDGALRGGRRGRRADRGDLVTVADQRRRRRRYRAAALRSGVPERSAARAGSGGVRRDHGRGQRQRLGGGVPVRPRCRGLLRGERPGGVPGRDDARPPRRRSPACPDRPGDAVPLRRTDGRDRVGRCIAPASAHRRPGRIRRVRPRPVRHIPDRSRCGRTSGGASRTITCRRGGPGLRDRVSRELPGTRADRRPRGREQPRHGPARVRVRGHRHRGVLWPRPRRATSTGGHR